MGKSGYNMNFPGSLKYFYEKLPNIILWLFICFYSSDAGTKSLYSGFSMFFFKGKSFEKFSFSFWLIRLCRYILPLSSVQFLKIDLHRPVLFEISCNIHLNFTGFIFSDDFIV